MTDDVAPVPDRADRLPLPAILLAVTELVRAAGWLAKTAVGASHVREPLGAAWTAAWFVSACLLVLGAGALLLRRNVGRRLLMAAQGWTLATVVILMPIWQLDGDSRIPDRLSTALDLVGVITLQALGAWFVVSYLMETPVRRAVRGGRRGGVAARALDRRGPRPSDLPEQLPLCRSAKVLAVYVVASVARSFLPVGLGYSVGPSWQALGGAGFVGTRSPMMMRALGRFGSVPWVVLSALAVVSAIGLLCRRDWGRKSLVWFYCASFLLGFVAFGRLFGQHMFRWPLLQAWSGGVSVIVLATLSTWFVVSYLSHDWVKLAMRSGAGRDDGTPPD